MRLQLKILMITGALVTAGLGAAAPAAATAPPTMDTSVFACSGSVCEVGPGNVGMPFAAGLNVKLGTYSPFVERDFGYDYTMTIISGSLPPGLKLSLPSEEWTITGTPTRAGTYPFTVQITPLPSNNSQGPSGTQQLTITIGTGSSDRLVVTGAGFNGHLFRLTVSGFDVNISALYTVTVTSTGKVIIPATPNNGTLNDGLLELLEHPDDPCGEASCSLTVTDSFGSSATVTLPRPTY
jgi:hypothetical protein